MRTSHPTCQYVPQQSRINAGAKRGDSRHWLNQLSRQAEDSPALASLRQLQIDADRRQSSPMANEAPLQGVFKLLGFYEGDPVYDTSTSQSDFDELAEDLLGESPLAFEDKDYSKSQVSDALKTLAMSGDEKEYMETELADAVHHILSAVDETPSVSSDDEVEVGPSSSDGQQVGKRFFTGQTYHLTVKGMIISKIGRKDLSQLVYKDKSHTNFDFWIERDGHIRAGINNSGGNEVDTGWYLTSDNSDVLKGGL